MFAPAGGQPYSVFGVLDAIKSIKPDVQTLGLGACYSYASLILVGGGARSGVKQAQCERPLLLRAWCYRCRWPRCAHGPGGPTRHARHSRAAPMNACHPLPATQASGTKGKRFAMKNTRIMMTQPMGECRAVPCCGRVTAQACSALPAKASAGSWRGAHKCTPALRVAHAHTPRPSRARTPRRRLARRHLPDPADRGGAERHLPGTWGAPCCRS